MAERTIKVKATVKLPTVPNFVKLVGVETTIPVGDLTDDELRALAEVWTEELLTNAARQRGGVGRYE